MLGEGSLSLATVRLLASNLTAENQQALVAAAADKSKRQVEEMLVRHFPRPEVASSVRKLPAPGALPSQSGATQPMSSDAAAMAVASMPPLVDGSTPALPGPPRRPGLSPLAPDRYEIRFTASAQTREKLRQAQDMLRHAIPTGDLAEVIDRALTTLLEDLARKKFAATDRPRTSHGTAPGGGRYISAKVRRAVWLRDQGSCAFVSKRGRRCNERAFVEFHHVDPYGVGGEATTENIQLRCRAHNAFESERFYGHGRPTEQRTLPGKSWSSLPSGSRHFT